MFCVQALLQSRWCLILGTFLPITFLLWIGNIELDLDQFFSFARDQLIAKMTSFRNKKNTGMNQGGEESDLILDFSPS